MFKKALFSLVMPVFFLGGFLLLTPVLSADFGLKQTAADAGYDIAKTDPADTVQLIVSIVLGFTALIFFGLTLFGGISWMLARGNDEKIAKAKGILETAIIGIIIISASYAIATFVLSRLSGSQANTPGCCTIGGEGFNGVLQENCEGSWQEGNCPA